MILERFVLQARLSFRASSRVVDVLIEGLDSDWLPVTAGTVRNWLVRLGTWAFSEPKEKADDWILFADHSLQVGEEKCLVVLGIRASRLPPPGEAIKPCHLHALAMFAEKKTDKRVVGKQLKAAAEKIGGCPLAIVSDEGGDLVGGIKAFCQDRKTIACSDIAHKAANLLRKAIVGDDHTDWAGYNKTVANIASRVRLTDAAFLIPPSQRSKARFMNLGEQFCWADKMLHLLDHPARVAEHISAERLEEKFGPLRPHRTSIEKWWSMQSMCEIVIRVVASHGYCPATITKTQQAIRPLLNDDTEALAGQLADFVREQCHQAPAGGRLPSSTEILESTFGSYKAIAGDHVKGGFTGLLPALGALVGEWDGERVNQALLQTPLKVAQGFSNDLLGTTYRSKRRQALGRKVTSAQ